MEQHIQDLSDLPKFSLECSLFRSCTKIVMFYYESGQTLEHVAWRGCRTSRTGSNQKLTGWGPEPPALTDPALSRDRRVAFRDPFQLLLMHWVYEWQDWLGHGELSNALVVCESSWVVTHRVCGKELLQMYEMSLCICMSISKIWMTCSDRSN